MLTSYANLLCSHNKSNDKIQLLQYLTYSYATIVGFDLRSVFFFFFFFLGRGPTTHEYTDKSGTNNCLISTHISLFRKRPRQWTWPFNRAKYYLKERLPKIKMSNLTHTVRTPGKYDQSNEYPQSEGLRFKFVNITPTLSCKYLRFDWLNRHPRIFWCYFK